MTQVSLSLIQRRVLTHRYVRNCCLGLCCVLAACAMYASRERASNAAKPAAPPVALRGEEAVAHLKQQGRYDSLAAAMEATRYQVRQINRPGLAPGGGAWQAINAAQKLSANFTSGALSIAEHDPPAASGKPAQQIGIKPIRQPIWPPEWQFAMTLMGYGYGDRLFPVSEGKVTANGSRIELARTSLADSSARITEWYVNDAKGLEQGFTLASPPPTSAMNLAGEKLRLRLALTGDLRAEGSSDGQSVALLNRYGAPVLNYGGLVVRDALGRELEARMTASDSEVVIETNDAGAVYPVVIDPIFTQFNILTGSSFEKHIYFGNDVALSGDTAVVGAPLFDFALDDNHGAAYVFVRNGTTWTYQELLFADDLAPGDSFGHSVAVSGDTALIGAISDDVNGNDSQGSAYVFVRSGTNWTQQQKLIADDGAAFDAFGSSVELSGDTALIGSYSDNIGGNSQQGSAFVFVRSGTTWTQQQKLTASDGAVRDYFGHSVALDGNTALIGAAGNNLSQGAAYVFVRSGTLWTQQQKLTADDGAQNDIFGDVALSGDTALVGSHLDDINGIGNQGSAYVFVRSGTTWTQQQKLIASDGAADDWFGTSVALRGDIALICASADDVGGNSNQGSAYVFTRSGTTWMQQQKLTASTPSNYFGDSVALSVDTALVGAPSTGDGAAYPFSISSIYPQQAMLVAGDGAAYDNFGRSVALSGDTALVGSYGDDVGGMENRGSAYVFVRNGTTWTLQQQLFAADGTANDLFGCDVALDGDTALIGAFGDAHGTGGDDVGSAYVFVRSGTIWTQQQKLSASDRTRGAHFAFSVALSGNTALIGAYGHRSNPFTENDFEGAAYVFVRTGTTWAEQQKLVAEAGQPANQRYFGRGVAIQNDTALIGAPGDSAGSGFGRGSAYVFVRTGTTWIKQQKLTASGGQTNDNFGISVAVGANTALVGALRNNTLGNVDQGAAYAFVLIGPTWTQVQKLTASDGAAGDNFGVEMALDGDTALIGAWSDNINGNALQGSAYIFIRDVTGWTQRQKLFASDGAATDQFGYGVALNSGKALVGSFGDNVNVDDQGSVYLFGVDCPTITITPATLSAGTAGNPYSQTLTGGGGAAPYSFAVITGTLPTGVTLSSSGLLSGTPTAFGSFNFTARATDNNGCQGTQAYTLTVNPPCGSITVNPSGLPDGTVGAGYNQTMTATGGTPAYSFTVSAGALPGGLNLASGGALTGTPNSAGTFNFTIKATDASGCMGTRAYAVTVSGGGGGGAGLQFYPLPQPVRLLETRAGFSGCTTPGNPINANATLTLPARTACAGIPASAAAVTGNITVIPSGAGFLTLFPSSATQPTVANSNFAVGEVTNNVFTVGLGAADGAFKIFSSATTHAIVDVTGYYAPPGTGGLYFHPLPSPVRLLETRAGQNGCITPGTPLAGTGNPNSDPNLDLAVQGRSPVAAPCNSIPASAQVLVGNATSVLPSGGGYLTIYPSGGTRPTVASSNYAGADVINGPFTVKLGAEGKFKIYTFATTHLVVDILGYYSEDAVDANGTGLLFNTLPSPVRLLETRPDFPGFPLAGCTRTNAKIQSNLAMATHTQQAAGFCGLPSSAQSLVGNVTVVNSAGAGFLTLFPGNLISPPVVATSNYPAPAMFGYNRHYFVTLSPVDGTLKVLTQFTTDLILDASGYFAP